MTTIRRITVSQIDGNDANASDTNEIRPFGETAFYLDQSETSTLTLMMFDGVRTHRKSKVLSPGVLYGSNADAGDGSNADTIKLIPDAELFNNGSNQYLVVDPTGGVPGHIHLRAGGTQDSSTADLYLGGEQTFVRVSDTYDNVVVRTTNATGPTTNDWSFGSDGSLEFPDNLKIDNSVISNLNVVGDLSTGSQIQVGSGVTADTGIIISNRVTNSLGGGSVLESGSLVNVHGSGACMALKTSNSLGEGGPTLTGENLVEVFSELGSTGVRIGVRVTNDLGDSTPPLISFRGWTFDNEELSLPIGTVISETPSQYGLYRTKYSGNFANDPSWFAANAGNIVNSDSFPEGILQNYDVINTTHSFQYFGYFVPPTSANYTFRAHADEYFVFWIGSKALSGYTYANKDMYGNYNGTYPEQQTQSFTIALTAGQFYPIRIQWSNSGGIGQLDVFTWANDDGQADTADFTGRVLREDTGTAKISVNDNRSIILSTDNDTVNNWTFGADGSLTLPIGVSIDSSVNPLYPKIIADSGKLFSVQGQGSTGSAALAWSLNPNADTQYAAVGVNRGGGDNLAKVVLTAGNTTATLKVWKFDETGALTIPGDIRSEGNINIDINLSDSTLRRWRFGEDGDLRFPNNTVQTTAFTGNAATVDITNTNGLTTTYYPTFVENRDGTEILRADVDFTYRTDDNLLTVGNITTGILKIDDGVHEKFQTKADATGIVTHNCSSGNIFYHTSPDANWTANFTNLNLSTSYATAVTLIISQGGTGYYPNIVQIDGVSQNINWQGNTAPTPSTSRIDVVTFSIINEVSGYTVLGQLTGF